MLAFCAPTSNVTLTSRSTWLGCKLPPFHSDERACETETKSSRSQRVVIHCGRRGGSRGGGTFRPRGDGRRPNRVAELIRREMSGIIDDEFSRAFVKQHSSSSVFISVVDVKCSDDLRHARVSVSVLGTEEQKTTALQWLKNARKELRFKLAQCVTLKYIPELSFTESEMAQALNTVTILDQLAKEREQKRVESMQTAGATASATSYASGQELGDDGLILDDLDMEGIFDIDEDDDDDAVIIHVDDGEEDLAGMSDEDLNRALYKTLGDDELARR